MRWSHQVLTENFVTLQAMSLSTSQNLHHKIMQHAKKYSSIREIYKYERTPTYSYKVT